MEYGIQALAGSGMVFAVITDLWQKKIAVYIIFTITIVLLFMQFCSGNGFIWICSLGSGSIIWNDRSSNGIMEKCHDHLYQFYDCFCCCIISDYFTQKK